MRYEFHPAALEEYRQAAIWYAEREPQVALKFVASVEDAIARIVEATQRWRVVDEDVRRCLTRFPFRYSLYNRTRFLTYRGCHALQPRAWLLEITNRRALDQHSTFEGVHLYGLSASLIGVAAPGCHYGWGRCLTLR